MAAQLSRRGPRRLRSGAESVPDGDPSSEAGSLSCRVARVKLAGLRVPDNDVRELARLVDEPTRSVLEKALAFETDVVALTIADRERILWALRHARTIGENIDVG